MGRKDANASMPIDDYRKKIGKQDYKKSKKEMKEAKRQSELKKSSHGVLDLVLMVGTFVAAMAGVYFMLYMYLHKEIHTQMDDQDV